MLHPFDELDMIKAEYGEDSAQYLQKLGDVLTHVTTSGRRLPVDATPLRGNGGATVIINDDHHPDYHRHQADQSAERRRFEEANNA